MNKYLKVIGGVGAFVCIAYVVLLFSTHPSNDRDWVVDNEVLPYAEFNGDEVTIYNVRNFEYRDVFDFTPRYYDKTYNLNEIKSVDFINEPFSGLAAHTLLSFGFDNGEYVAISVEVRREERESFGVLKGLLRRFELVYIIADERDVVKLRTNYRKDDVYVYPMKISRNKARELFVDMLERANKLHDEPEFYNTLTNNCTTNLVRHVNNIAEEEARIDFTLRYVFPKFSGRLAYDLGIIDMEGTFEEVQKKANIYEKALKYGDDPLFSQRIREELHR